MPTQVIVKIIETPTTIKVRQIATAAIRVKQIATAVVQATFDSMSWTGDGTRVVFVLDHEAKTDSLSMYLNGIFQEGEGIEYTLGADNKTVTFVTAPPLDWRVRANYAY